MPKRIVAGLIVAAAAVSGAVAGSFEDGVAVYDRGDYPTALKLWRPLAEQGNAVAQTDLGWMYVAGEGLAKDYAEALKWFRLAASMDYEAQHALGFMYEAGLGAPKDLVQAYMWLSLAAAHGDKKAAGDGAGVAKLMTPDQIAEAQRLAREWKPTPAQ